MKRNCLGKGFTLILTCPVLDVVLTNSNTVWLRSLLFLCGTVKSKVEHCKYKKKISAYKNPKHMYISCKQRFWNAKEL